MKAIALLTLALTILVAALAAEAQPAGKVPRVGLLITGSPSLAGSNLAAFQQGLRDLGYVEGQNLILEYRYAEGRSSACPSSRPSWCGSRWTCS